MVNQDLANQNQVESNIAKYLALYVKYITPTILVINIIKVVGSYFDINLIILDYLFSIIALVVLLYILAKLLKFCAYYTMMLNYIIVSTVLNMYDTVIGIPISDYNMLVVHLVILGIFIIFITILYLKYGKIKRN